MDPQEMVDREPAHCFLWGGGRLHESGIPDFRSVDGLYHQQYDTPPETILSHSFFLTHPEEFYRFYRAKMLSLDAQPNAAHLKLAELEQAGRLSAVITQNIDGLHQKAGSRTVLELHGSIWRNHCMRCGKFYPPQAIAEDTRPGSPVYLRRMDQARRGPLRGRVEETCLPRPWVTFAGRTHADRGRNQPDGIPRPLAWCGISGGKTWCSSIGTPRPWIPWRGW